MPTFPFRALAAALPALAIVGLACSRQATTPVSRLASPDISATSRSAGLVDLSIGRATRIEGVSRLRILPDVGDPGAWVEFPVRFELRIVGTETPITGGAEYVVERSTNLDDGSPYEPDLRWRQDRTGLYLFQDDLAPIPPSLVARMTSGLDAAKAAAVERAIAGIAAKRAALHVGVLESGLLAQRWGAGTDGVGPHEITFLRYPLHPGATWVGRPGFNVWTVEALETVVTPAGRFYVGRMRIELPEFFGPDDSAHTWWGVPGEVRRAYHLFSEATSDTGEPLGRVEFEESFLLTGYSRQPTL